MRHKIKLTTLTQVHVGSGEMLLNGSDFIASRDRVYLLDINKVGQLIGIDRTKAELWSAAIDNDGGQQFLERELRNAGASFADCSTRTDENLAGPFNHGQQLREGIHDGRGLPYLPGSSIKGAIRTALLADKYAEVDIDRIITQYRAIKNEEKAERREIIDNAQDDKEEQNNLRQCRIDYKRRYALLLKDLERIMNNVTGSVQQDPFRLLQVGDAYFRVGDEIVLRQVNLNERTSTRDLIDKSKALAVEAIKAGVIAESTIKLVDDLPIRQSLIHPELIPNSIQDLFSILNQQTKMLVEFEIEYWEHLNEDGFTGALGYINACNDVLKKVNECNNNQCVIRMGNAIGWNFMTGGWLTDENFDAIFKDLIVNSARPKNEVYYDFEFPKSRRIDARNEHPLFGFVLLTAE